MITENLSILKIHKLTQAQYDREFDAGRLDENALYLTPDVSAKVFMRTVSIGTAWTASGGYYYQDISVDGILASDYPTVGINTGDDNAANVQYKKDFSNVIRIATSDGSIRVWSTTQISSSIPIQIQVVR